MRLLLAMSAMVCFPAMAQAQEPRCLPYDAFIEIAQKQYGERPVLQGVLTNSEAMLVVFANPQTGTFTTGLRMPSGQFCLHMAGDGMQPVTEKPASGPDT